MESAEPRVVISAVAIPMNNGYPGWIRRFFRHAGKEAFIVGQNVHVVYHLRNTGAAIQSGALEVTIKPPNGQYEISTYRVVISQMGEQEIPADWGILAPGFSLFACRLTVGTWYETGNYVSNRRVPIWADEKNRIEPDTSFFSIYAQNAEEFYQLWGSIISAIGLFLVAVKDYLVPIASWFIKLLCG